MTDLREHRHVFRPGPFHPCRVYWLEDATLHWRVGPRQGHVALADIAAMRLHMPANATAAARCVLVETSGRRHRLCDRYWPRWTREERHAWGRLQRREATFRDLAFTLARRLRKANPHAVLETGPSRGEWLATCSVAALAFVILVGGIGLMVVQNRFEPAPVAFMALAAVQLPLLWPILRSGGPKHLDPDSLPEAGPP
jgi:hypothetical protein